MIPASEDLMHRERPTLEEPLAFRRSARAAAARNGTGEKVLDATHGKDSRPARRR